MIGDILDIPITLNNLKSEDASVYLQFELDSEFLTLDDIPLLTTLV